MNENPYQAWCLHQAGIIAPKVCIRSCSSQDEERGLYATAPIQPNERILYIPAQSLIGSENLSVLAEQIVQERKGELSEEVGQEERMWWSRNMVTKENTDTNADTSRKDQLNTKLLWQRMEEDALLCLQEFQAFCVQQFQAQSQLALNQDGTTTTAGWRKDDSLALFLIACRLILDLQGQVTMREKEVEQQQVQEEQEEQEKGEQDDEDVIQACAVLVQPQVQEPSEAVVTAIPTSEPPQPQRTNSQNHQAPPRVSFLPHIKLLPSRFYTPVHYTPQELSKIEGTNCHGYATRIKQQIQQDWEQLRNLLGMYCESCICSVLVKFEEEDKGQGSDELQKGRLHVKFPQEGEEYTLPNSPTETRTKPQRWFLDVKDFTLERYQWALSNVYSRATDVDLPLSSEEIESNNHSHHQENSTNQPSTTEQPQAQREHRRVIIPLLDMMNHDFSSHLSHSMDYQGNVSVFNNHPSQIIPPDSQLCLNYGPFPNEKLLLVYGFCLADGEEDEDGEEERQGNPYNAVQMYAPLSPEDGLYQAKMALLKQTCGMEHFQVPHALTLPKSATTDANEEEDNKEEENEVVSGGIPPSLLSALRLIGIRSAEEFATAVTNAAANPEAQEVAMISPENEYQALSALEGALRSMSRRLALNLIEKEATFGAASFVSNNGGGDTSSTITGELDGNTEIVRGVHERNCRNAKILCQGEYRILLSALHEVMGRLEVLSLMDGVD